MQRIGEVESLAGASHSAIDDLRILHSNLWQFQQVMEHGHHLLG